jgi:hypothetical protein
MIFSFDGANKRITLIEEAGDLVNGTITFSAMDVYSAWKDWCVNGDGLQYPFAFRAIGNDPIGGGVYVGSYFFIQEGWTVVPPSRDNAVLILKGNLYTEVQGAILLDPLPEYTTTLIMQNSSLTQVSRVETGVSGLTAEESTQLAQVANQGVSVYTGAVASAVWENSTRTLTEGGSGGLDAEELHVALDNYVNKDDWKADTVNVDLTETNAKIDAVKADTGSVKTIVEALENYDDTALVSKVDAIKNVVDQSKLLLDEIDSDVDALDENNVNSIYAKLIEVNQNIQTVLDSANNIPQSTYDMTFGKLV